MRPGLRKRLDSVVLSSELICGCRRPTAVICGSLCPIHAQDHRPRPRDRAAALIPHGAHQRSVAWRARPGPRDTWRRSAAERRRRARPTPPPEWDRRRRSATWIGKHLPRHVITPIGRMARTGGFSRVCACSLAGPLLGHLLLVPLHSARSKSRKLTERLRAIGRYACRPLHPADQRPPTPLARKQITRAHGTSPTRHDVYGQVSHGHGHTRAGLPGTSAH